ncbi:MAG: histidine kinase [Bacteroidales bacterium]|nr:histidine kinase [Bacteroidales bacterium]
MLKIKHKEIYLIEIAKLGGMLVYLFIGILVWSVNKMDERLARDVISSRTVSFVAGYISISLLYLLINYQNRRNFFSKKAFFFLLGFGCYLAAILWVALIENINSLLNSEYLHFDPIVLIKGFSFLYLVIAFVGLYYLISYRFNLNKQKEMTLQATNLANEAQLQMLRYQINPHFLFNALNTIRSMIEEDKTVARNMITELSNFFRYSLSQNGTTDTFENEINAIKNYLEIQKIRFEEKLMVTYDIDDKIHQMKIPFFIILPLVENAIKFGLQSSTIPLNIKIVAKASDHLEISVHNTGKLVENSKSLDGTKTGIENTKKRLSLYFADNYSFKLYEQDSWVIAQIIINDYKNQLAE